MHGRSPIADARVRKTQPRTRGRELAPHRHCEKIKKKTEFGASAIPTNEKVKKIAAPATGGGAGKRLSRSATRLPIQGGEPRNERNRTATAGARRPVNRAPPRTRPCPATQSASGPPCGARCTPSTARLSSPTRRSLVNLCCCLPFQFSYGRARALLFPRRSAAAGRDSPVPIRGPDRDNESTHGPPGDAAAHVTKSCIGPPPCVPRHGGRRVRTKRPKIACQNSMEPATG